MKQLTPFLHESCTSPHPENLYAFATAHDSWESSRQPFMLIITLKSSAVPSSVVCIMALIGTYGLPYCNCHCGVHSSWSSSAMMYRSCFEISHETKILDLFDLWLKCQLQFAKSSPISCSQSIWLYLLSVSIYIGCCPLCARMPLIGFGYRHFYPNSKWFHEYQRILVASKVKGWIYSVRSSLKLTNCVKSIIVDPVFWTIKSTIWLRSGKEKVFYFSEPHIILWSTNRC